MAKLFNSEQEQKHTVEVKNLEVANVVDRHRVDADPKPIFFLNDADPDPNPSSKFLTCQKIKLNFDFFHSEKSVYAKTDLILAHSSLKSCWGSFAVLMLRIYNGACCLSDLQNNLRERNIFLKKRDGKIRGFSI